MQEVSHPRPISSHTETQLRILNTKTTYLPFASCLNQIPTFKIVCVCVCLCVYAWMPCRCQHPQRTEDGIEPLELELQLWAADENTENWTSDLWMKSKHSYPRSHLCSPSICFLNQLFQNHTHNSIMAIQPQSSHNQTWIINIWHVYLK